MQFIIWVYLFFILASLYSVFLVILIHLRNRNNLYDETDLKKYYSVSVLIPAWNKQECISDTIKAVQNVDYYKELKEIIVIDDKSTDNTLNIVKQFGDIKIIAKEKNAGKASALNTGIKEAKGEIIVVIDADSFPEKDSFKKMLPYFKDPKVGAVTSTIIVKDPKNLLEKMQAIEYYLIAWGRKILDFVDSVYVTPGPLSMYRKDLLLEIEGFDTNNITEDIEIAWKILKIGYKNKMCLAAKVYTDVPKKMKHWWKQRVRWDIGGLQTINKYKSSCFKKEQKMFGLFVVPRFIISHILSLTGFFVFIYISYLHLKGWILANFYNIITKTNPLRLELFHIVPSVFTFFIIFFLFVTIFYTILGLKSINKEKIGIKGNLRIGIYLLFYLTLYPLILIHSIFLLLTKNIKW